MSALLDRDEEESLARVEQRLWELDCRDDLTNWAVEALEPMEQVPARHHRILLSYLKRVARGEIDRLMVCMPPGHAKALALDTPIPTPKGWAVMGELRVGDQVYDENGDPCTVTWVSPVWRERPVYSVRTDCGDEIIADRDHEWAVRLCGKRSVFKIKETWQLARRRAKRPMILRAKAIYAREADLPIDPYLLGVWLGDGNSGGLRVTCSVDDQSWLRAEIERLGYETTDQSVSTNFGILGARGHFAALGLLHDPRHATIGEKHIPPAYLRGSVVQRRSLIQGLVDTDGTVSPDGQVTFTNTNRGLALGVQELARSLGVKATLREGRAMLYDRDCGPVWRVSFYMANAARMPRKRALCRDAKRTPNTYIDVEPAGFADTVCIEVNSPSHLFLCGRSMTPTHNSTYCSVLFPPWMMAQRPHLQIIGASHGADLAEDFSSFAQGHIRAHPAILGYALRTENVKRWRTTNGGFYRAAGVGGSITGRRADLGIIDDPVKSAAEAESLTMREATWQWYQTDFYTRLKPGAAIVVIMTRWHEDDLGGRLLQAQAAGGDQWTVIKMPALADSPDDPLGRNYGEALWPEWQNEAALARIRQNVGEYVWGSLYQQDPKPRGASFFDVDKLLMDVPGLVLPDGRPAKKPAPMPDKCDTVFATVDTAIKSGAQHNSTAVTWWSYNSLTTPSTYLLDWDIVQIEGAAQSDWLPTVFARSEELAVLCGARRGSSGALVEDKATGTVLIQQGKNLGQPVTAIDSKLTAMGKEERAIAAAPYVNSEDIKITEEAWNKTKVHKGRSANHQITQVSGFRIGSKESDGLDLLDTFCYGILITHGTNSGPRKGI